MALELADFHFVRDMVQRRAAIVLEDAKAYLVEMRLEPLVRDEGCRDIGELVARSRADSRMQARITVAMTTNETSFFRDTHPFSALKDDVLPAVIADKAAARQLTIWCAAASSGQEPYSIAMILLEHFPEVCDTWRVEVNGTDLSGPILDRAREAVYRPFEVERGLPKNLLNKYFIPSGREWAIKPAVKRLVHFREMNLIEPFPSMTPPDIVFIRNVLIYFNASVKSDILRRIHKVMSPSGYLFLGGAETTLGVHSGYTRHNSSGTAYYRPIAGAADARV